MLLQIVQEANFERPMTKKKLHREDLCVRAYVRAVSRASPIRRADGVRVCVSGAHSPFVYKI